MPSITESFDSLKQSVIKHTRTVDKELNDSRSAFDKQFTFLTEEMVSAREEFKRKILFLNQCLVVIYAVLGIILIVVGLLILKGL